MKLSSSCGSEVIVKVNCKGNHPGFVIAAALALLLFCASLNPAQERTQAVSERPVYGSLSEIANKQRVLLIVNRAAVVDASDDKRAIMEALSRANPQRSRRYRLAYNTIARKLNGYIKRYRNMRPVDRVEDADYIIFFNLLEYRWPLGIPYPYGELFVIVSREPARILWQSKKVQWAEDAVKELLNDLKLVQVAR